MRKVGRALYSIGGCAHGRRQIDFFKFRGAILSGILTLTLRQKSAPSLGSTVPYPSNLIPYLDHKYFIFTFHFYLPSLFNLSIQKDDNE